MELDLNHLVLTFALGSAALLLLRSLLDAVGWDPMRALTHARVYRRGRNAAPPVLFSATAIAVAVAFGVVLENVAKKETWRLPLSAACRFALVTPLLSDMDLRRQALLACRSEGGRVEYLPSPILAEVLAKHPAGAEAEMSRQRLSALLNGQGVTWRLRDATHGPATQNGPTDGQTAKRVDSDPSQKPCYEDFYHATPHAETWPDGIVCVMVAHEPARSRLPLAVNAYYYAAKNEVFLHDTYFQELRLIEDRENFVRAFALLCIAGAGAEGLLLGSLLLLNVLLPAKIRPPLYPRRTAAEWGQALLLLVLLVVGYLLAATAFAEEANEFYIRVFGYYASLAQ
jgi:hypothetical protein